MIEIEALWEDGVFKPLREISLKRSRVVLSIPEEALEPEEEPDKAAPAEPYTLSGEARRIAEEMQSRLEAVRRAAFPPDEELPAVNEKEWERIRAFAMREDR